jgi:hypothetical protein
VSCIFGFRFSALVRQPWVVGERAGDGVEGCEPMVYGGVEVAADVAPPGDGSRGVSVAGHGLVLFGGLDSLLGAVVRPLNAGFASEQPDLVGVVAQPAAEGVAGVVAVVPVPVPVVRDAEGDGLVVTLAQLRRKLRIQGRIASGQGLADGLMGFAEHVDDVSGPELEDAEAQPGDRAASADDMLPALLHSGEPRQELLVGGVPVADQEAGEG